MLVHESNPFVESQYKKRNKDTKMDTKLNLDKLIEVSESTEKCNYIAWRFKLNLILRMKGLFNIATGVTVKPFDNDTNYAEWYRKDLEA